MRLRPISWKLPLVGVLPLLLFQACGFSDRPKPEDEFYCKVDGRHWRPNGDGDFKAITLTADISKNNQVLGIIASNYKTDEDILISIADSNGFGEQSAGKLYELSLNKYYPANPSSAYYSKAAGKNSVKKIDYATSATHKGSFRILSLEADAKHPMLTRLKAEFEFTAVNSAGEIVRITNGQFNDWIRISQ